MQNIYEWLNGQMLAAMLDAGMSKTRALNLAEIGLNMYKRGEIRTGKDAMKWTRKQIERHRRLQKNLKAP